MYQRNRVINRTVFPADRQAMPPRRWCASCGAEVYGFGALCRRCDRYARKLQQLKRMDK